MIRLFIPDPDFLPIPDPGIKKAPEDGSGSATLLASVYSSTTRYLACFRSRETLSYPLLLLLLLLDLGEGERGDEMLWFGRGRVGEHVGVVVAGWDVHAASAALHLPLLLLLRLFLQLGFILLNKNMKFFSLTGR
jgi:hypothetical protein